MREDLLRIRGKREKENEAKSIAESGYVSAQTVIGGKTGGKKKEQPIAVTIN